MTDIVQLTTSVGAVAPIYGIGVGSRTDKTTWRIDFKSAATTPQMTQAYSILNSYTTITQPIITDIADTQYKVFVYTQDNNNQVSIGSVRSTTDMAALVNQGISSGTYSFDAVIAPTNFISGKTIYLIKRQ